MKTQLHLFDRHKGCILAGFFRHDDLRIKVLGKAQLWHINLNFKLTAIKNYSLSLLFLFVAIFSYQKQTTAQELWGMTSQGGTNNVGLIFKTDANGNNQDLVYSFTFDYEGRQPLYNNLVQASNGKLYGMTSGGGSSGYGVLFEFDPGNGSYNKKMDFDGTLKGRNPSGGLMQASNGKLYGMTSGGGSSNYGVLFEFDPMDGSFIKKLDFDYTLKGAYPNGSLMQASNGKLYGMTREGGSSNYGVLFEFDPMDGSFIKKLDFDGSSKGAYINGSLMQASNGKLYGMTRQGGSSNYGVLFEFDPIDGSFIKKLDFDYTSKGALPLGSLMQASNGKLYGMTRQGGSFGNGVLFEFDPMDGSFVKKLDFDFNSKGRDPYGSLMQAANGKLYGMTRNGGSSDGGVLFEFDPSEGSFVKKVDFEGTIKGSQTSGTLLHASNGKLYGMTRSGGSTGNGVLFEYDLISNTYSKKLDFDGIAKGGFPYGSLMQASNGKLFGMTYFGGISGAGVLFEYDPDNNTYTKILDFDGTTKGSNPAGNLMQASNGKLYGMTFQGGALGGGVLFEYDPISKTYVKKVDFDGVTKGSNPSGTLLQAYNGKLYGLTYSGGISGVGVLFEYDPGTNTFTKKLDFDITAKGSQPSGSLMQASNGKLYGMTRYGGVSNLGVLFEYDPMDGSFIKKLDFDYTLKGAYPYDNLMQASNGKLYGMTFSGGTSGKGVLFEYEPTSNIYTKKIDFSGSNGAIPMFSTLVEVGDFPAPIAICKNATLQLDNNGQATLTASQIDGGSSGTGITLLASKTNFTCSEVGENTVTLIVTDRNSNTRECNATVMVEFNNPPIASVTIETSNETVCEGTPVTFTATPVNEGETPTYQWKLGEEDIQDATGNSFSYIPKNGDVISVVMTSSEECASGSPASSNAIEMTVNDLQPASVSIEASDENVCEGTTVTFTAIPVNEGETPAFQWKLGEEDIEDATGNTYSYVPEDGDIISVVMTSYAECASESPAISNAITMQVNDLLAASVSIEASDENVCEGTTVTFTALPINEGEAPTFQWMLGEEEIEDAIGNTFSYVPEDGDAISVVMTSSAECVYESPAISNAITMQVNDLLAASVSIEASNETVCEGTSVTFTALPINEGEAPTFQWMLGEEEIEDAIGNTFSYVPEDGDAISVVMTSSAGCVSGSPATSNAITMTVNELKPTSVSIEASAETVCEGTLVTFTATPANEGETPSYQWKIGEEDIDGATDNTYSYEPGNGDVISVVMTSNAECVSGSPATSNTIGMTANPLPTVTCPSDINAYVDPEKCFASVRFEATAEGTPAPLVTYKIGNVEIESPYLFPVGTTTVSVEAVNDCKTATCSFTVTVTDNINPTISAPIDLTANTDEGECTKTFTSTDIGTPTVEDNCSASVTWARSDGASNLDDPFPFGVTTITWTATDDAGNSATADQIITIENVTTAVTVSVSPTSQQYSDNVTFTANVTVCAEAGTIGGTVEFKVGSQVMGSTEVGPDGTATLEDIALLEPTSTGEMSPGGKTVTASYSGSGNYLSSTNTTNLTITKEDADVAYNGGSFFSANPSTYQGTIVPSAFVVDEADDSRGDIRNATVTFRDGSAAGSALGSSNIPVGLVSSSVTTEGVASTNFNYTLSNSDLSAGGKIWDVWTTLDNYYDGQSAEYVPVTLGLPGPDYVTGGGHIVMSNSSGKYAGDAGRKMNFGLVMKWNKSGKNLQGNINVIYRRSDGNYQIKSNAINSLVVENVNDNGKVATGTAVTFRRATITTKANLKKLNPDGTSQDLGGNLTLTVTAWESTTVKTGASDRISVQLAGSNGSGINFSSNWSGGNTMAQQLGGGKIQVFTPTIKSAQIPVELAEAPLEPSMKAFPNPFTEKLIIEFSHDKDAHARLDIYSITGARLETLFDQSITGGEVNKVEYLPRLRSSQMVLYHLIINGKTYVGKVTYNERR